MGKHKLAPDQNLMFLSLCTVLWHSRCGLSKLMYLLPPFAFGDVRLHKKLQLEGPLQGLPRFLGPVHYGQGSLLLVPQNCTLH